MCDDGWSFFLSDFLSSVVFVEFREPRRRKKKLKVKIHSDGGEKVVVFDDEGNAQRSTGVDEEAWKVRF